MKLYCKSYWVYTDCTIYIYLNIYSIYTSFHYITVVLRVWGWQSQKCNSNYPNDINTEWAIPEKCLGFSLYPLRNSSQNKTSLLETPHNSVTPFRNFKAYNQEPWRFRKIFSWSRPENFTLVLINPWKIHLLFLQYPWKFHILHPTTLCICFFPL